MCLPYQPSLQPYILVVTRLEGYQGTSPVNYYETGRKNTSNVLSGRKISSPQTPPRPGGSHPCKKAPRPKAFVGPTNMIHDFNSACLLTISSSLDTLPHSGQVHL